MVSSLSLFFLIKKNIFLEDPQTDFSLYVIGQKCVIYKLYTTSQ